MTTAQLVTTCLIGFWLALAYVFANVARQDERADVTARVLSTLSTRSTPAPRIADPDEGIVTYEDRAKWLPTNIRRDIERSI